MASTENYAYLMTDEPNPDNARDDGVIAYRTKTIKAGDVLEVEAFPVVKRGIIAEAVKRAGTRPAQARINDRNSEKRIIRLFNANFGAQDIWLTTTYDEEAPDRKRAMEDMRKFVRKVRKALKKQGKELKYVYALGYETEGDRRVRIHGHIIMTGMDRDEAEKIWKTVHAGRVNAHRVQPGEDGLRQLAGYFHRQHKRERKWCCSKNLIKPTQSVSNRKLSRGRAAKVAVDVENSGREIFERLYPGYRYVEATVKTSEYLPGAYIYALMIKRKRAIQESDGGIS